MSVDTVFRAGIRSSPSSRIEVTCSHEQAARGRHRTPRKAAGESVRIPAWSRSHQMSRRMSSQLTGNSSSSRQSRLRGALSSREQAPHQELRLRDQHPEQVGRARGKIFGARSSESVRNAHSSLVRAPCPRAPEARPSPPRWPILANQGHSDSSLREDAAPPCLGRHRTMSDGFGLPPIAIGRMRVLSLRATTNSRVASRFRSRGKTAPCGALAGPTMSSDTGSRFGRAIRKASKVVETSSSGIGDTEKKAMSESCSRAASNRLTRAAPCSRWERSTMRRSTLASLEDDAASMRSIIGRTSMSASSCFTPDLRKGRRKVRDTEQPPQLRGLQLAFDPECLVGIRREGHRPHAVEIIDRKIPIQCAPLAQEPPTPAWERAPARSTPKPQTNAVEASQVPEVRPRSGSPRGPGRHLPRSAPSPRLPCPDRLRQP